MISKAAGFGFVVVALALASCSSSDLGTGMNTVDREYNISVKEAHEAALSALKATTPRSAASSVPHFLDTKA